MTPMTDDFPKRNGTRVGSRCPGRRGSRINSGYKCVVYLMSWVKAVCMDFRNVWRTPAVSRASALHRSPWCELLGGTKGGHTRIEKMMERNRSNGKTKRGKRERKRGA